MGLTLKTFSCEKISNCWVLKSNQLAKTILKYIIFFVKMALTITDYRAKILLISGLWYPWSRPSYNDLITIYTLSEVGCGYPFIISHTQVFHACLFISTLSCRPTFLLFGRNIPSAASCVLIRLVSISEDARRSL